MRARILGAGVMGMAIATELAARGHQVELVDPEPAPGPHACSWWAGGMLAPHCEAESTEKAVERHGLSAIDWWDRHTGAVSRNGTLVLTLARDRGELARFGRRSRGHSTVDAEAIAKLEPDLAGRFTSGLFYPDEAHLAPRAALMALRERLVAQGATFHTWAPDGAAAVVIDARGLAARDALPDLRGVRGEMLVLRCPDLSLSRPVRLLHPRIPLYIVPRGEGVFMLGATMIESDRRGVVTARSLLEMLSAAYALHPAFGEAVVLETGADARPAFPDNLPRLRRRGATLYANGLYRHGFLLSPAVARMAADHLESDTIPEFMDEVS
ncbi:FAD-dependent oxidoreductase [Paenirhodobacter populi]|uniref:D-amino-acid oxidase n=1 Tax=Paenirhodobacter populi TaxID=2306993 RepID=A0A443J8R5_9RHOB|nr:FAD-dependent oxidoreductase [Sinirhodobacter populi]RWR04317.1 FAD-dependent oxidoreductase [Sinirhodobacter populi]RWR16870.1 FAD-dependent oxidoreductase [Sinirhodobacter populi]